ncbi:uncharacterized protein LOC113289478 [Papaver somniferum]|uniref:uncharacterized protein LOC113289478 n=1 Tax=Papaver somniferum TaxID=3469 RepID=UPI000E703E35|nr:uncharacterized protein LOC113289478 [Papaver somniferum]
MAKHPVAYGTLSFNFTTHCSGRHIGNSYIINGGICPKITAFIYFWMGFSKWWWWRWIIVVRWHWRMVDEVPSCITIVTYIKNVASGVRTTSSLVDLEEGTCGFLVDIGQFTGKPYLKL